jgi:hypothetical protein
MSSTFTKSKLPPLNQSVFGQSQVLQIVVGLKGTDIQNWANRSLLGSAFLKRGRGRHRTYSTNDCLLLALMLRLRSVGLAVSEAVEWIYKEGSAKASLATLMRNIAIQKADSRNIEPVVLLEIAEFGEPLNGLRYNIMAHELIAPNFDIDVFAVMRQGRIDHLIFIDLTEVVHRVMDGVSSIANAGTKHSDSQ